MQDPQGAVPGGCPPVPQQHGHLPCTEVLSLLTNHKLRRLLLGGGLDMLFLVPPAEHDPNPGQVPRNATRTPDAHTKHN